MEWFGGIPAGTITTSNGKHTVTIPKAGSAEFADLDSAKEWQDTQSAKHGLTLNMMRIVESDLDAAEPYLEVQLQKGMLMKCDVDHVELVEGSLWYSWQSAKSQRWFVRRKDGTFFHNLVCPNYQRVHHINNDNLDNRTANLKDATPPKSILFQANTISHQLEANIDLTLGEYELQELPELSAIKTALNVTKTKIDAYHSDKQLQQRFTIFTNKVRITNSVKNFINKNFNAQHVTRAWLKLYELHLYYQTVPKKGKFVAFLNAELPGATICTLNHIVKTLSPGVTFEWKASSFIDSKPSPDREFLSDDYGLYKSNPKNWMMTDTNNGDMTDITNILDIEKRLGPESVDLYTHDAGIGLDHGNDFNDQESLNARLHLGCALMGFMVLKKGGTFVAKQYTFFEPLTVDLLVVYAGMFEEFFVCKPMTSGQSNSEIYLVGKGFKGMTNRQRKILTAKLSNFNMKPIITSESLVDSEIYQDIVNVAQDIFGQQTECLNYIINLFQKCKSQQTEQQVWYENRSVGIEFSKQWLKKYPVYKIHQKDHIVASTR